MPTLPAPHDTAAFVARLREALRHAADPDKAPAMAAYMKGHFPFLGVAAPVRKVVQKPYLQALRGHPALVPFAHACWALPERELHYVACDALRHGQGHLRIEHLTDLRDLLTTHSWWDTVDILAVHPVGHLVKAHPALVATMDAWIEDANLWLARTALLHQLTCKADTDEARLFRYVLTTAHRSEFFLRKAQGWALRTHARHAPDAVRAFVGAHEAELSGLTRREALKHLRRV